MILIKWGNKPKEAMLISVSETENKILNMLWEEFVQPYLRGSASGVTEVVERFKNGEPTEDYEAIIQRLVKEGKIPATSTFLVTKFETF